MKFYYFFYVIIEMMLICNREVKINKDNGENNDIMYVYVLKKEYIVGVWVVDKS